jgi:hypothetical protein
MPTPVVVLRSLGFGDGSASDPNRVTMLAQMPQDAGRVVFGVLQPLAAADRHRLGNFLCGCGVRAAIALAPPPETKGVARKICSLNFYPLSRLVAAVIWVQINVIKCYHLER